MSSGDWPVASARLLHRELEGIARTDQMTSRTMPARIASHAIPPRIANGSMPPCGPIIITLTLLIPPRLGQTLLYEVAPARNRRRYNKLGKGFPRPRFK